MALIGALLSDITESSYVNPWPLLPDSHVVICTWSVYLFRGDEPFKDQPSTYGHLTSLTDK